MKWKLQNTFQYHTNNSLSLQQYYHKLNQAKYFAWDLLD
jgi:hypothetical protein